MYISIVCIDLTCKVDISASRPRAWCTPKLIPFACGGLQRHVFSVGPDSGNTCVVGIGLMSGVCYGRCSVGVEIVDLEGGGEGVGWVRARCAVTLVPFLFLAFTE